MDKLVLNKAIRHLKKDKNLAKIISKFPRPELRAGRDYFGALLSSIIYQQITGKAAQTIEARFRKLFKSKVKPEDIKKLSLEEWKSAGISPQKMKYIIDLSEKFLDKTINPKNFHKMSDEDIKKHIVAVKGIGPWTGDMFLIFTLNRLDILPTGDLGIQKGFMYAFGMKSLPSVKKMEKLAKSWSPYRTIASMYLWKVADKAKENK